LTYFQAANDYFNNGVQDVDVFFYVQPGRENFSSTKNRKGVYQIFTQFYFSFAPSKNGSLHFIAPEGATLECGNDNITLIYVDHTEELELNGFEVRNCREMEGNGGIGASNVTRIKFLNSYFHDNSAYFVGGVATLNFIENLLIYNCTFERNSGNHFAVFY
jgi:hypothetical protein